MGVHKKPLKRDRRMAEKRERQRKALELRKAGMTYAQIGQTLTVDQSTAHRLVKTALDEMIDEPVDDLRKMMSERLNTMLMVTWAGVQAQDGASIDRAMRIMDRQGALMGLNAPQRFEVNARSTHVLELGGSVEDYRESLRAYRQEHLGTADDNQSLEGTYTPPDAIREAEVVEENGEDPD